MKDDQLTLRLPRELSRALDRRARERGVPKSQLVREALQAYLAGAPTEDPAAAWRRVAPMVGSLSLDAAAIERDALATQVRAHNWRESRSAPRRRRP
jgi:hypothetical protein